MSHFILYHNHLLVTKKNQLPTDFPFSVTPPGWEFPLDSSGKKLFYSSEKFDPPPNYNWLSLRQLYGLLSDDLFAMAGKAHQIGYWAERTQFCSRCAHPLELKQEKGYEPMAQCLNCQERSYLNPSPAIIVSIRRGNEILLARNALNQLPIYSVLAGFVSAGENLETTVAREVFEETRIEIQNIRYFGSQAWPFPNSLMIGFTAEYAAGKIEIDPTELQDAQWFTKDNLPRTPSSISISAQLIAAFIQEQK